MRSALLEVDGVTRVQVSLERKETLVTYDPRLTNVDALVAVVNDAAGPIGPSQFTASVKERPKPAPRQGPP